MISEHHGKTDPINSKEINDVIGLDSIGSFPNTRKYIRDIMFEEKIPIVGVMRATSLLKLRRRFQTRWIHGMVGYSEMPNEKWHLFELRNPGTISKGMAIWMFSNCSV